MSAIFRKSLVAGAIAALISAPGWGQSAADPSTTGQTPGQPSEYQITPPGTLGAQPESQSGSQLGTQAGSQTGAQAALSGPLSSMTPAQLRTMSVVDQAGEEVGTVHSVVRNLSDQNIQLVISPAGSVPGMKQVAIPLEEVNLMGEKLQLSSTRAEISARPEMQPAQVVELTPADQPISDFAAFEPVPGQENQLEQQQMNTPASPGSDLSTPPGTTGSDLSNQPSGTAGPAAPGTVTQ